MRRLLLSGVVTTGVLATGMAGAPPALAVSTVDAIDPAPSLWHLTGDFNNDDKTDIALVGRGWTMLPVALSNGSGGFGVPGSGDIGEFRAAAARDGAKPVTGDFNKDGRTDIALIGGKGWTTSTIAFSVGNGTFNVVKGDVGAGFGAWAATDGVKPVAGDFDNDGRTDIALVGGKGMTTLWVAFSIGNGAWAVHAKPAGDFPAWVSQDGVTPLVGDFNNDTKSDIALVGAQGWTTAPIAFSNGDGSFRATNGDVGTGFGNWASRPGTTPLTGDFNHDNKTDIALAGVPGLTTMPIAFSNGDGAWGVVAGPVGTGFGDWASRPGTTPLAGDFDNDGNSDVALVGVEGSAIPVAYGHSDGSWGVFAQPAPNNFSARSREFGAVPLAGDFNNDKKTDIALTGGEGWTTAPIAFAGSGSNGTFTVTDGNVGTGFGAWASKADIETAFQPSMDYDTDGCYPVPAIGPDGVRNQGLPDNGDPTSGCHDRSDLDTTNSYSRVKCNNGWCGIVHAYYFEKDVSSLGGGHRNDLEHVVVWVRMGQDSQPEFVAASQHEGWELRPSSQVLWEGNHPKIVYHKDGSSTHAMRFATSADEPPENDYHTWQRPALVGWNNFPVQFLRDLLNQADFGDAKLNTRDSRFNDALAATKPAGIPFDPYT